MFAINANLNEIREQRRQGSWEFALHRARDAKLYTSLYVYRLKGDTLSPQEEVRIMDLEDWRVFSIKLDYLNVSELTTIACVVLEFGKKRKSYSSIICVSHINRVSWKGLKMNRHWRSCRFSGKLSMSPSANMRKLQRQAEMTYFSVLVVGKMKMFELKIMGDTV